MQTGGEWRRGTGVVCVNDGEDDASCGDDSEKHNKARLVKCTPQRLRELPVNTVS